MWLFNVQILTAQNPADGTFVYCSQDVSLLPDAYDNISADGTFVYCSQDISGLPRI